MFNIHQSFAKVKFRANPSQVKEYCPLVFRGLRERFDISEVSLIFVILRRRYLHLNLGRLYGFSIFASY